MRVLVPDTTVLIDLERGHLLEVAFGLSYEFVVPDLLYMRELRDYNGPELLRLGLRVEALDEDGLRQAIAYQVRVPALSLPYTFAIALAKVNRWILLAGDAELRRLAAVERVEHHGILWVLDQLLGENKATPQALHDGLTAIHDHPRCRLPVVDIRARLAAYARLIRGGASDHRGAGGDS
jgi:hypothetical protein